MDAYLDRQAEDLRFDPGLHLSLFYHHSADLNLIVTCLSYGGGNTTNNCSTPKARSGSRS